MAENFDYALQYVLNDEGGEKFTDYANDPGGATKFGISLRFAGSVKLDLNHDGFTTKADIVALTKEDAYDLYKRHFWLPLQCHLMPGAIGYMVFDCGVNQGLGAAAKLIQRTVGVPDDGQIGPRTLQQIMTANHD